MHFLDLKESSRSLNIGLNLERLNDYVNKANGITDVMLTFFLESWLNSSLFARAN